MDIELQKFLLRVLGTLGTIGAPTEYLHGQAKSRDWPQLTRHDLEAHLFVLGNQQFVVSHTPPLQTQRWAITPAGELQLRILGFA